MIFIPGNVPSLKNSKIKTANGVFPSKTVKKYLQSLGIKRYGKAGVEGYKTRPNLFDTSELREEFKKIEEWPALIGFHFVRDSKRTFDFNNANQILCDLLVAHGLLPDDDIKHMTPVCMRVNDREYSVNPKRPGVYVEVLKIFQLPRRYV